MANESFSVFCPTCNIQVEARTIARGHGGFTSTANPFEEEIETEYHGDTYCVAICSQCQSPFLFKEALYTVLGDGLGSTTTKELIFPQSVDLPLKGVPDSVKRAYEQAQRCFVSSSYDACALMCRRSLEALCKSFNVQGRTLEAKLKALADVQIIEARLVDWAHGIRHVGNEAAHDTEAEVSKEDARDALDFTEALLTYVFVLNDKFAIFSARRKSGAAHAP